MSTPLTAPEGFVFGKYQATVANMPVRTWLAGMALQGALASPAEPDGRTHEEKRTNLCSVCVNYADSLLAALSATPEAKATTSPSYAMENPLSEIVEQMDWKGGEFVRRLSYAMLAADGENLAKIIAAFPEVIERYDAFATLAAKERQTEVPEP